MRHRKKTVKLGRTAEHRKSLLANQVCSLIEHGRIKTTLAKAKAVRPFAEKMVTLGKKGSLHNRRTAIAYLHQVDKVKQLFEEVAPRCANRAGGYTRIVKLGPGVPDSAPMPCSEWVDKAPADDGTVTPEPAATTAKTEEAAPAAAATPKKAERPARDPDAPKKPRANTAKKSRLDKAKRAEKRAKAARAVIARSTRLKSASERSKAAAKKRSASA